MTTIKASLILSTLLLVTSSFIFNPMPPAGQCNCGHLEVLQIELRNAQKLQQAFRNKIPELQSLSHDSSVIALNQFAQGEARRGLEAVPNYNGPNEVDYEAYGNTLHDSTHPPASATNEGLCKMTESARATLDRAKQAAACDGIGNAVEAHEEVHHKSCLTRGWVPFFNMSCSERAREEVDAYQAQINVLKAEIAQVLERSQITVISEMKSHMTFPSNPLYSAMNVINDAEIATNRVGGSTDRFTFEGQGQQNNNATIDGNCQFTGGLPYKLPVRVTLETDGLTAEVHFQVTGTTPSIAMKCQVPGAGSGYGMSMPAPVTAATAPVAKMPLKDGAEVVFDVSKSEAAAISRSGGVEMTGTAKVRLKCSR